MNIRLLLFFCLILCSRTVIAQTSNNQSIGLVMYCPADIQVECRSDIPPPNVNSVTASSSCQGNITITHIGDISNGLSCPETISRVYFATDLCGNSTSCTQLIVVNDVTDPVLSGCPADLTVQCLADVPLPANVTATDNCDGSVPVSFTESSQGICPTTITRQWIAYDSCGNNVSCSQTIIVSDTTDPVISGCPADGMYGCLADVPLPANVTATDNCDGSVPVSFTESSQGICPTTITRHWIAYDACGNSKICIQTIIVMDETDPEFAICPSDTTVATLADVPPADSATVSVVDDCGDVTIDFSEIREENPTRITRIWNAYDACGNMAICTQLITVAAIPTITNWGIGILIVLLLAAGTVVILRRSC